MVAVGLCFPLSSMSTLPSPTHLPPSQIQEQIAVAADGRSLARGTDLEGSRTQQLLSPTLQSTVALSHLLAPRVAAPAAVDVAVASHRTRFLLDLSLACPALTSPAALASFPSSFVFSPLLLLRLLCPPLCCLRELSGSCVRLLFGSLGGGVDQVPR